MSGSNGDGDGERVGASIIDSVVVEEEEILDRGQSLID